MGNKTSYSEHGKGSFSSRLLALTKFYIDEFEMIRIENRVKVGMPDIYYEIRNNKIRGWIELKVVDSWNKPKKISHFTSLQKKWLEIHGKRCGFCWILIYNNDNQICYLFDYNQSRKIEGWSLKEWWSYCRFAWKFNHENGLHIFINTLSIG